MTTPRVETVQELIRRLLDGGYNQTAGRVVEAIIRNSNNPLIQQRISELEREAERLAQIGERMQPDNAVLRATLVDLENILRQNSQAINGISTSLIERSNRAAAELSRRLALRGITDAQSEALGIRWNVPDPEAVAALIDFSSSPAWARELQKYGSGIVNDIRQIAIRGIVNGWNPRKAALEIVNAIGSFPRYRAETLMRTLQLQSYRRATTANYLANADILEYRIRIAVLDRRTCMSCVALHGRQLRLDEEVADHHNGRCTSIPKVRGLDRNVRSGADWFASLSQSDQQEQMGYAAWAAWNAGDVQLNDFVHRYDDDVFGPMVRESSLKDMLGDAASRYYRQGRDLGKR